MDPQFGSMNEAANVKTSRNLDVAISLKDIQDIFSAGFEPLLDGLQRLECHFKDADRAGAHFKDAGIAQKRCEQKRCEPHEPQHASNADHHAGSSPDTPRLRQSLDLTSDKVGSCLNDVILQLDMEVVHNGEGSTGSTHEHRDGAAVSQDWQIERQCSPDGSKDGFKDGSKDGVLISRPSSKSSRPPGTPEVHLNKMMVQREMACLGATDERKHSKVVTMFLSLLSYWHSVQEPPRSGCAYRLENTRRFENCCMFVIFLNSVFVAYVADWEMKSTADQKPESFTIVELVFNSFFCCELLLKLGNHRLYYFINQDASWNSFDFILVVFSVLDQVLTAVMPDGGGAGNVGFMRILRLMRLAKIFRAFRTVRFFKELSVLAESFKRSLCTLFWSIMLLALMLFIFSLIFLQALTDYKKSEGLTPMTLAEVQRYFGGLGATMLSLYMAVTGGDDWIVFWDIISAAGPFYAIVFLLFTFFFMFALFNILTGMLVEKAVSAAQPDRNDLVVMKQKKNREDADELLRMCKILDQDGGGTISRQEFDDMLENTIFTAYMSSLGLEVKDPQIFYSTIAGSPTLDEIPIEEFVDACVHMRGHASSVDMKRQLLETTKLLMHLEDAARNNSQSLERMESLNSRIGTVLGHVGEVLGHVSNVSEIVTKKHPENHFKL